MELILSFAAGVVACGLALPVISWVRGRIARYRQATDAEANQVTTVSQVLHLAGFSSSLSGYAASPRFFP